MSVELLRDVLGWCTLINLGLLVYWFAMLSLAHDFVYAIHTRWFSLSVERFDAIHYAGMAFFKLLVTVFNLVPYLALRIVT